MSTKAKEKESETEVKAAETTAEVEVKEVEKRVFNTTPLRSVNEIVEDLHKPVHPRFIKKRKQGGTDISYIAWYDATKYLDLYAPGWTYEIRNIELIGKDVVLTARITIPTAEGWIYKEATGSEDATKGGYGDPYSNSESMALRRCAAKWGLGQHLYRDK